MTAVKQVRYSGQDGRVLVDVGALNDGDIFNVSGEFAAVLVKSFPDTYEIVEDAPLAKSTKKKKSTDESDAPADDTAPDDTPDTPAS